MSRWRVFRRKMQYLAWLNATLTIAQKGWTITGSILGASMSAFGMWLSGHEILASGIIGVSVGLLVIVVGILLEMLWNHRRRQPQPATTVAPIARWEPIFPPTGEAFSTNGKYVELDVAWETARLYPGNSGTADQQLRNNENWPKIKAFACRLFGHPVFTQATWERLRTWLLTDHVENSGDLAAMPQAEIVKRLQDASIASANSA